MTDCDNLEQNKDLLPEPVLKNLKTVLGQGSESHTGNIGPRIEVCSENLSPLERAPTDAFKNSTAIIRKRPKFVTQQGTQNTKIWEINFDTKERWENPLMGWCSSGDPLSNITLSFNTSDEAIEFADKRGWSIDMEDEPPKRKKIVKKDYSQIFHWNRRSRASTK